MDTSNLMEQILSSDNLNGAYLQVVRNKGAEGVDGMKYTELKEHLEKNGEIIKEQLRTRKYKPQPVRRVEIPKPDGGVRNLGVPTVTDRFFQCFHMHMRSLYRLLASSCLHSVFILPILK